jgi:type IV pilus assembly protein PilQ
MRKLFPVLCACFFFGGIPAARPEDVPSAASQENVQPAQAAVEQEKDASGKITLDLKGIDILEFFRIASKKMGVTIVPSKGVSGRVNIFLNSLTMEDALDVIMVSQDLAAEKKGSIINVMTAAEYEKLYGEKYNEKRKIETVALRYAKPSGVFSALGQLKSDIGKLIVDEASGTIILIDTPDRIEVMKRTIKNLDRLPETEIFDIKYAKAADIKSQLAPAITSGPGELYVDERSGKVVVTDLSDKMSKLRRMLDAFDQPSSQVTIEAEIVQITLNKEYQREMNWEKIFKSGGFGPVDLVGTFPASPSFSPSPALDTASAKATVGTLAQNKYTATFKFLETLGNAKILSSPRITVLNNQEAKVLVGTREAYITSTSSQAQTTTITSENVQFIDVGVKLSLTPSINKDGYITIKIKPEVSRVSSTITTAVGSRVPIVETSEAETVVKVRDGTMVMIAGLMKEEKRDDASGIPVLSRLPLVGWLFGSKANQKKTTELIIFLTPHVSSGDASTTAADLQRMLTPDSLNDKMQQFIVEDKLKAIQPDVASVLSDAAGAAQPDGSAAAEGALAADAQPQKKFKGLKQ